MSDEHTIAEDILDVVTDTADHKPGAIRSFILKKSFPTRMTYVRGLAEIASVGGAVVATAVVMDTMLRNPYDKFKEWLDNNVVEPNIKTVNWALKYMPTIESPRQRDERLTLASVEQAAKVTDIAIDTFFLKFLGATAAQFVAQKWLGKRLNVEIDNSTNALSLFVDKGVSMGSLILMNTQIAEDSVRFSNGISNVLQKTTGMNKEEANSWATYALNVQVPNIIGFAASLGVLLAGSRRIK